MIRNLIMAGTLAMLAGCITTDTALHDQGHTDAYIIGFHDGRHSGMREAGNHYEHFVQDRERYDTDEDYRNGWIAGEEEGRHMQAQADSVGTAAAVGISAGSTHEHSKHSGMSKEAMEKATKGVDTSVLRTLEK